MSTVAITQDLKDIGKAIEQALEHLKIEPLIHDKVVGVKPNETFADDKDTTGVTQPDTLRAVLRYLKQFNPRKLIVRGGSGAGETAEIMRVAGLMTVVEDEQVEFVDHNQGPFQEVALEYAPNAEVAGPQKSVMVNPQVLEYDTLISLAQLKLHETATVTLSLKNIAMSFPAADLLWTSPVKAETRESFLRGHALIHRRDGQTVPDRPGDHRRPTGDDRHRPLGRPRG